MSTLQQRSGEALMSSWVSVDVGAAVVQGLDRRSVTLTITQLRAVAQAARSVSPSLPLVPLSGVSSSEGDESRDMAIAAQEAFRQVELALGRAKWPAVRDAVEASARKNPECGVALAAACGVSLDKEALSSKAALSAMRHLNGTVDAEARAAAARVLVRGYGALGPQRFDARAAATLCRGVLLFDATPSDVCPLLMEDLGRAVKGVLDDALTKGDRSDVAAAASFVAATRYQDDVASAGARLRYDDLQSSSKTRSSVAELVKRCAETDLWDSAEDCVCATRSKEAALELVEAALAVGRVRQADGYCRKYEGLLETEVIGRAALEHAKATLEKVIAKGQCALVEKIVRGLCAREAVEEIRQRAVKAFALECLRSAGEYDQAHELCEAWDLRVDERDVDRAKIDREKRRQTYFQWTDAYGGEEGREDVFALNISPPPADLASSNEDLAAAVDRFLAKTPLGSVVGLDAEWDDVAQQKVSVLQIASKSDVILVDAAALVLEGRAEYVRQQILERIFSSYVLVGFAANQDKNRLARAKLVPPDLQIVDLQPLAAPHFDCKHPGLGAVAKHFLDKSLDKSNQCSPWARRPLSLPQRVYAALDAWVLVELADVLLSKETRNHHHHPTAEEQRPNIAFQTTTTTTTTTTTSQEATEP